MRNQESYEEGFDDGYVEGVLAQLGRLSSCRRCQRVAYLNANGYCSDGCEMGYKPGEFWI